MVASSTCTCFGGAGWALRSAFHNRCRVYYRLAYARRTEGGVVGIVESDTLNKFSNNSAIKMAWLCGFFGKR